MIKFSEIASLRNEKYSPNAKESLPYIGLEHIEQQTLRLSGVGDSSAVISPKNRFYAGDILFGKLRPYFRKVYRPNFDGVCSADIWVVNAKEGFDQAYIFYLMASKDFINECDSGSSGTRMPRADWKHIANTLWEVPSLEQQELIGSYLSDLDRKIELNRKANQTLEEIAQAIFKEWFVDFNYPGATGELVDSPLGPIPKAWEIGTLSDFGNIICGKTPSKGNHKFFGGKIPFIKIPDMHNMVYILDTTDSLTEEGAKSQKKKNIPGGSILVSCIATIGLVSLTSQMSQTNQQINAIIPKHSFYTYYAYHTAKNLTDRLINMGSGGSATLNINTTSFSNVKCILPSNTVLLKFDMMVKPLFEKILSNQYETKMLGIIRDSLIEELIS